MLNSTQVEVEVGVELGKSSGDTQRVINSQHTINLTELTTWSNLTGKRVTVGAVLISAHYFFIKIFGLNLQNRPTRHSLYI